MNGTKTKLTLLGALVALSACGSSSGSNVKGHVSDSNGSQMQAMAAGVTGLGGQGTASAATTANAYSIAADGSLSLVASAQIDAQGDYALSVPDGAQKLVIQAANANGAVVASVIASQAGTADAPEQVQPMSSETSLEAQVLVQMVKQGTSVDSANTVDLETRIDTELAAAVQAKAAAGADVSNIVASLATSIRAAQDAEVKAYADSHVTVTQSALFTAEVKAATTLDAQLASGTAAAQAYETFFASLAQAKQSLGIDAKVQNQGERDSGAAFNVTVKAELNASADTQPLVDLAIRNEAALEARTSAAAINAILAAGNASAQASTAATQAITQLQAQVSTATDVSASTTAFATFAAQVSGSSDISTSVFGTYLGASASSQLAVQGAVSASSSASATLGTSLDSAFTAATKATGALDVSALATQIVSSYSQFDAAMQSEVVALASFGAQAQPAVDLLIVAQGSFKMN